MPHEGKLPENNFQNPFPEEILNEKEPHLRDIILEILSDVPSIAYVDILRKVSGGDIGGRTKLLNEIIAAAKSLEQTGLVKVEEGMIKRIGEAVM